MELFGVYWDKGTENGKLYYYLGFRVKGFRVSRN